MLLNPVTQYLYSPQNKQKHDNLYDQIIPNAELMLENWDT